MLNVYYKLVKIKKWVRGCNFNQ